MSTNYEIEYQRHRAVCGEPFQEFVAFFGTYRKRNAAVLDLGCGQGRDALMIAAHGHEVYGVDITTTGITQMKERARKAGLRVRGEVADIREYEPKHTFDIVVLDRVIHMLSSSDEKRVVVGKAIKATKENGYLLVADTASNIPLVETFFEGRKEWKPVLRRTGFRFFYRLSSSV